MQAKYQQLTQQSSFTPLLAGMALPLSFAPFHLYPIAVVSLALLFFCWQRASAKQALWSGFLFGMGFFGVGVAWIYVAIHDFGDASILLSVLLTALFVGFFALYIAAMGFLVRTLTRQPLGLADYVLLLPSLWVGFEWFKGWFLTGFPWLELGTGQIDSPLSGYVPIIGTMGASMLVAISAGLLVVACQQKKPRFIVIMLAIWLGGYGLQFIPWTTAAGDKITASLIQGNVPQKIKWHPKQAYHTMALYQSETKKHWQSDLIIWPEGAITLFYHQIKASYLDPLAQLAKQHNAHILLGLPVMDDKSQRYFNSMISLGRKPGIYHKQHLVPFGEYTPFSWLRWLMDLLDLPMSSFQAGPADQPLLSLNQQKMGVYICYEDAFSAQIRRFLPAANFLVNATNNAWYGRSLAPHQHLQISRSRALEVGRPVLRATTNGISAFIDHQGRLKATTPQFKRAVLTGDIQPRKGKTPYVIWGDWLLLASALFMLLIWGYYRGHLLTKQTSSCSF